MSLFRCPLCRAPLDTESRRWHCPDGHSFDVAREGYVNLLPVQHKHSRAPGDEPGMVRARHDFLAAGHYAPLRDAVIAGLQAIHPEVVLDLGCGEGYYTAAMSTVGSRVVGVDIAKPAIRLAARSTPGVTWLVASGAQLPLADQSVDVVCNLFTQLHHDELRRVLRPAGQVLVVTPTADHLLSLREALFDTVRPHVPDKFLTGFSRGFTLRHRQELRVPLSLEANALAQLLQMTPYAWKARPERREALLQRAGFHTEAAFTLLWFQRQPDDPCLQPPTGE